jgi:hypothetical protein
MYDYDIYFCSQLVGAPCGQHGQYTFYKGIRLSIGDKEQIVAIGDFFFVRIWQDSELVSIGKSLFGYVFNCKLI